MLDLPFSDFFLAAVVALAILGPVVVVVVLLIVLPSRATRTDGLSPGADKSQNV